MPAPVSDRDAADALSAAATSDSDAASAVQTDDRSHAGRSIAEEQTMRDEEWDHVDDRKFIEARLRTRDLEGLLVPESEAIEKRDMRKQQMAQQLDQQQKMVEAQVREVLSQAFKNITQGQKNAAAADAATAQAALKIMAEGIGDAGQQPPGGAGPAQ